MGIRVPVPPLVEDTEMTTRVAFPRGVAPDSGHRPLFANGAKTRPGRKPSRGLGAWALALALGALLGAGGCSRKATDFPAVRCPSTDWPTMTSPDQSLSSRIILCGWHPAGKGTTFGGNEGKSYLLPYDIVSVVAGVEIESRSDAAQEIQIAVMTPIGPSDDMLFEKLGGQRLPGTVVTVAPHTKRVVYVQSVSERLDQIAGAEVILKVGPIHAPLPPVPAHDELFGPGSCTHNLAVAVQSSRWELLQPGTEGTDPDGQGYVVRYPLALMELALVITNPGPYPVAFFPEELRVDEPVGKTIDSFYISDASSGGIHPLIAAGRSMQVQLRSPTCLQADIHPTAEMAISYSGRKLADLPPFPQSPAGEK